MAEFDVDGLPVELNKIQQKRVDNGEHEQVAADIRKLRRGYHIAHEDDPREHPTDYNDIADEDE